MEIVLEADAAVDVVGGADLDGEGVEEARAAVAREAFLQSGNGGSLKVV